MLRNNETEKEIILGNKQLFGIFLSVAVLLGIAFIGGYMVGKGTAPKPAAANAQPVQSASTGAPIGETHSIPAVPADSGVPSDSPETAPGSGANGQMAAPSPTRHLTPEENARSAEFPEAFTPAHGERFLQVAAVTREEADAVADVLQKKGFRAHAVQKPGKPKIYRVLIGPIRSAGDLSATRDALRRTGFSEVITQRY
ncbi:MAG: SPOR domain-containing protein [Bryobacteraceae bacterium]